MTTVIKLVAVLVLSTIFLQGCSTPQVVKPPDVLYKEGEELFQKGNYEEAIAQWKKVKESYQSPELTTKAELNIADAYFLNKDYIEAAAANEDFRKLHPTHPQAAFALYRQGMSYFNQINSIDTDQTPVKNALSLFESYLRLYPAGAELAEVREKIRDCRDKQLQYEIYVGRYYLRTDAYKAAIGRFEEALKKFPDLARLDEVLYRLGQAYLENGQKPKARETLERLIRDFSASAFAADAKDLLGTL